MQRRKTVIDNVRLVLIYIVEVQEISPARFRDADDGISLREQLTLSLDDEGCIMKHLRKPFVGAVMMGHDQPATAYKGNCPIKHCMVDINTSQPLGNDW